MLTLTTLHSALSSRPLLIKELRELRKSEEAKSEGKATGRSSSSGNEVRVGEDEVDEALKTRDEKYEFMKNDIENNSYDIVKEENSEEVINDLTLELVNKFFSLEFVNRIDEVIMFNPLSLESVQSICKVQISKVKALLNARGNTFMGHFILFFQ